MCQVSVPSALTSYDDSNYPVFLAKLNCIPLAGAPKKSCFSQIVVSLRYSSTGARNVRETDTLHPSAQHRYGYHREGAIFIPAIKMDFIHSVPLHRMAPGSWLKHAIPIG